MCALAYYLETEGLATTLISLVRLHSETMRPPRVLWVPFELGRPLGPPNDAGLQRDVLTAALDLLTGEAGPVVHRDFDYRAPAEAAWTCPFETGDPTSSGDALDALAERLRAEFQRMLPWYRKAEAASGRSVIGVAGLEAEALVEHVIAGTLALAAGGGLPASPLRGMHPMQALRFAVDDLKACYLVAATADGATPSCGQHNRWFWRETLAGRIIVKLRELAIASDQSLVQVFGKSFLVTREYL